MLTVVQVHCRHNSSSPPVQERDGKWSVGDVLKGDTLSSTTVYLRERRRTMEQMIQHLQEEVSMSILLSSKEIHAESMHCSFDHSSYYDQ